MRLFLEIVIAAALVTLSWNKSFKEWAGEAPVIGQHFTAPAQTPQTKATVAAVTSQGPQVKATVAPATSATPQKAFTGHIYYTDEHGKSYWLDAQGKRHYQP